MTNQATTETAPTIVQDYRSYTADEILRGILEFSESRGWTDEANLGHWLGAARRWAKERADGMSAEFNAGWNGAVEKLAAVLDLKGLLSWRTDSRDSASSEPLSPSPEIRYEMRDYHHVHCHSYRPGGACTCWEQREKLIAEWAGRETGGKEQL